MKIAVACGGTGGHVFPGLAAATLLQSREHDVTLWLSGRSVEQSSVEGWSGKTVYIRSQGFNRGMGFRAAGTIVRLIQAWRQCRQRMREDRPDILLAMGSYASVGPVMAARSLRIPIVLHEANAVPGRAISFLSRYARVVAVTSPEAGVHFSSCETSVTGFPLRDGLIGPFDDALLPPGPFTVLVMGGSLGAHMLNEIASDAMCLLNSRGVEVRVLHLSGAADEDEIRLTYKQAGVQAEVLGFLGEMGKAYDVADLAVCRAGAASCAELAACGVPALFVPLPSAPRDHQARNAEVFVRAGAADMCRQSELTPAWLAEYIEAAMNNGARLESMRQAMLASAVLDATERLANLVEGTA